MMKDPFADAVYQIIHGEKNSYKKFDTISMMMADMLCRNSQLFFNFDNLVDYRKIPYMDDSKNEWRYD